MQLKICLSACLLCHLLMATVALAETRFVTDELTINLRRGMGNEYRILKMLPTGTPVEILERHGQYAKVREPAGTEGYVLTQFLTTETPKGQVAARLEKENARLVNELNRVKESYQDVDTQINQLQAEIDALEKARSEAESGFREFQHKYERLREDAGNVLKLQEERDHLKSENLALETEVIALREASSAALRTGMIRWFVAGAGVLFTGWILGSISRNKRKKSSLSW